MLFPYKYVPHQMEKMQEFIDFIFYEVWCEAPGNGPFCLDLFNANVDLKEVMETFYYSDAKGAYFFSGHVERIYGHFATLATAQVMQFKQWYQANNDIEKVCGNDPTLNIARYVDIAPTHQELSEQLSVFFKGLYSLNLAALKAKIGDLDDHYQNFMKENFIGKCPFCGMADMQGFYHSKREAYDHYLPKSLYPFNSMNCKNLVPACHHCNSTYKSSQDPAYAPKDPALAATRRKVFYPYTTHGYHIDIQIELKKTDVEYLTPNDIEIEFGPASLSEEIETWKDVYGIEERYKAKCCCESDGKYWLTQVLDEWKEEGRAPADYLKTLTRQADTSPFADSNFLKKAFLEGCDRAGLFNVNNEGA
ncbi:HNH endonuclease [Nitrospira sp. T9]|uniref:HNH endonuclease n=1 Tax=unclassified Nitrospira TaxID=2652172 RepID=UPI003F9E9666